MEVAAEYANLVHDLDSTSHAVSDIHHEYISSVSKRFVILHLCTHYYEDIDRLCSEFVFWSHFVSPLGAFLVVKY